MAQLSTRRKLSRSAASSLASACRPLQRRPSSRAIAAERGLKPIGRLISSASAGVEPTLMGIGPVEAIKVALKRANMDHWGEGGVNLHRNIATLKTNRVTYLIPINMDTN